MYAIKTEKLTKKYKEKTAVSNLDLKINEGEMYGFRNELYLAVLVNAYCKGQNNKLYDEIVHISAQSTRVYYRLHTSAFANGNFTECRMRCCCVLPRT